MQSNWVWSIATKSQATALMPIASSHHHWKKIKKLKKEIKQMVTVEDTKIWMWLHFGCCWKNKSPVGCPIATIIHAHRHLCLEDLQPIWILIMTFWPALNQNYWTTSTLQVVTWICRQQPPLIIGKTMRNGFPFLKNLAYNILSIPVSSAAAEREFSASGWHSLGRKNRTTGVTLAAKVFLTCNKDLLRHPFFKSCLLSSLFFAVFFSH